MDTCQYKNQAGAVLLIIMISIILSASVFLLSNVSLNNKISNQQQKTRHVLAQAKQALIDYAVNYYETNALKQYALLPCPELSGSSANGRQQTGGCLPQDVNVIGRLPWFTLGIAPLVDGSGECLWYAVTGAYKFAASGQSKMLNDDTLGMFQLLDETANVVDGRIPEDRIVALVIAPGNPLSGQNRATADTNVFCKVDRKVVDINDYLEAFNGINNAAVSTTPDNVDQFITTSTLRNKKLNDQFIAIHQSDIFKAIHNNSAFQKNMDQLTHVLSSCIASYARTQACNAGRQCIVGCNNVFNTCITNAAGSSSGEDACRVSRAQCLNINNCDGLCDIQNNGNSGSNNTQKDQMQLPLPASIDLFNTDYRLNKNYIDLTAAQANNNNIGLLGRYMFDVNNSISDPAVNNIFEACGEMDITGVSPTSINMVDINNKYRRLWQHWKDHFFYVVGKDMTALNNNLSCGGGCPILTTTSQPQAAMVLFSAERLNNQHRQSKPPEPSAYNIPTNFGKDVLTNYLELNINVYPDINGNKHYQKSSASNDIFYCIDTNLVAALCP